jgi:two-component system sensor histidine kinase KdpD
MKSIRLSLTPELFGHSARAVLVVAVTTALLLLVGRDRLGEAVVALLYLVPIGWSASQWGQLAGMSAAVAAGLAFNFLFIPPYYTFVIGSLEGYLVWVIFLVVAVVVVGRIQASLSRAQTAEREAVFMYELSAALAGLRAQSAVAYTLARHLQQMYQTPLVKVIVQPAGAPASIVVSEPHAAEEKGRPDRIIPIWNAWGLAGEIQLWRGPVVLPPTESRLFQNFASQAGQALERTRLVEAEERAKVETPSARVN